MSALPEILSNLQRQLANAENRLKETKSAVKHIKAKIRQYRETPLPVGYVSIKAAAERYKRSPETVKKYVKSGNLPCITHAGTRFVNVLEFAPKLRSDDRERLLKHHLGIDRTINPIELTRILRRDGYSEQDIEGVIKRAYEAGWATRG